MYSLLNIYGSRQYLQYLIFLIKPNKKRGLPKLGPKKYIGGENESPAGFSSKPPSSTLLSSLSLLLPRFLLSSEKLQILL